MNLLRILVIFHRNNRISRILDLDLPLPFPSKNNCGIRKEQEMIRAYPEKALHFFIPPSPSIT
jgi:hypothetical protein